MDTQEGGVPETFAAKAFWVTGRRAGELRPERVYGPGPDEVLVETLYSGISRGTESLVFGGRIPPSEYRRMRAPFQAGDFPFPVKYGYANVGIVRDGPDDLVGNTVFCLHPHQSLYTVPARAVVPLPPNVPTERAVLAANMETALNGVWDAKLQPGDRVCVIGAGVVGCLVAHLAHQTPGCQVQLVDIDERKREIANKLGIEFRLADDVRPEADRVIHTSGSPRGLSQALAVAGSECRIVEMSWFGDQTVELTLGGAFHARRLTVVSSQVGKIPAHQQARWTHRRRLEMALELLADDILDPLVCSESHFTELPESMSRVTDPQQLILCHRIRYG